MALQSYELPIDFDPDHDLVNNPETGEYLAWRLSTNPQAGTSLWVINPIVESPTPIEEITGEEAVSITINQDTNTYGYVRQFEPNRGISTVEQIINIQTENGFQV